MTQISQREARRLRKRVTELENALEHQRRAWSQEYFYAVNIATVSDHDAALATRTARKLHHAVVVVGDDGDGMRFMALPHPKVS